MSSTKKGEFLKLSASLAPLREKDFESTGYSSDPKKNEKLIGEFLTDWVHEPFSREAAKGGPRRSRPSLGTRYHGGPPTSTKWVVHSAQSSRVERAKNPFGIKELLRRS